MLSVKMQFNQWNPWTSKSALVPYIKSRAGIGNGEEKVAAELDGTLRGQNSPYDMDAMVNNCMVKLEVKEPDAKSFRSGRNGRDAFRPVKAQIASLLLDFVHVRECPLLSDSQRTTLLELHAISPDELCEKNLQKITNTCHQLSGIRDSILASLPSLPMYNPLTGERKEVSAMVVYNTATGAGVDADAIRSHMGADIYASVSLVVRYLSNPYIQYPNKLMTDLGALREIFRGYIVVLVDEQRGFYLMDSPETKLIFQRVTLAVPRFRVDI